MLGSKSIHNSRVKNLVIWHHKKLLYPFYLFTVQNIQQQWIYFSFQHNKIIYLPHYFINFFLSLSLSQKKKSFFLSISRCASLSTLKKKTSHFSPLHSPLSLLSISLPLSPSHPSPSRNLPRRRQRQNHQSSRGSCGLWVVPARVCGL